MCSDCCPAHRLEGHAGEQSANCAGSLSDLLHRLLLAYRGLLYQNQIGEIRACISDERVIQTKGLLELFLYRMAAAWLAEGSAPEWKGGTVESAVPRPAHDAEEFRVRLINEAP